MKKTTKKITIGLLLAALTACGGVILVMKQPPIQSPTSVVTITMDEEPSFSTFVEIWNDKVRAFDLNDGHQLSSTDDKTMLHKLKSYISFFSDPLPRKIVEELKQVSLQYPHSIWAMYRKFLNTYTGKRYLPTVNWQTANSSEKLEKIVLNTVRPLPDSTEIDDAVKTLLAASDPCVYFNIYKTELWKRGLSKNFKHCNADIVNAKKYPKLASLIK